MRQRRKLVSCQFMITRPASLAPRVGAIQPCLGPFGATGRPSTASAPSKCEPTGLSRSRVAGALLPVLPEAIYASPPVASLSLDIHKHLERSRARAGLPADAKG
jgi:hypothetical protein